MEDNKGIVIDFNEPNESRVRREGEAFPGEIDTLNSLVMTWLKYQPKSKGKSVKLESKKKD